MRLDSKLMDSYFSSHFQAWKCPKQNGVPSAIQTEHVPVLHCVQNKTSSTFHSKTTPPRSRGTPHCKWNSGIARAERSHLDVFPPDSVPTKTSNEVSWTKPKQKLFSGRDLSIAVKGGPCKQTSPGSHHSTVLTSDFQELESKLFGG